MISLRNLMEDKRLDFNQPLLSVRRFSSTATSSSDANEKTKTKTEPKIPPLPLPLPVYKSELKSGPLRNPGTVPFVWEQTPGKPKDESKTKSQLLSRRPLAPKLPPGRIKQECFTSVNASSDDNVREIGEEKKASCGGSMKDDYEEEDEEEDGEIYRDANDIFSRSESFFMNCSISGVSGLDGSEVKPSGNFSTDSLTRNFMMDRFLPAAKAMASETPPHTVRKQTATVERPREIRMATNGNTQNRPKPYVTITTQHVQDKCEEESEDEDDDYDRSEYSSARGCGFLPRFCLKSSFVLLNPVQAMKMRATPVHSVRRIRNSSARIGKSMEENASKFNERNRDAVDEPCRRTPSSFQALLVDDESGSATPVVEKTLYIDSVHKTRSPNSSLNSLDIKGITNYSGDVRDDASVKTTAIKELYTLESETQYVKKLNDVHEKTVMRPNVSESVDSCSLNSSGRSYCEVKMELNCSRFNGVHNEDDTKFSSSGSQFARGKKFDLESHFPLKPSNQVGSNGLSNNGNNAKLTISDGTFNENVGLERKQPEKSSYADSNLAIPKYGEKLESDDGGITETGLRECFHGFTQESIDRRTSQSTTANNKTDSKNQFLGSVSNEQFAHSSSNSKLPFAPPAPKSPSDSWLKRTLPTSSRNSSVFMPTLAMRAAPISMASTSPNPIWETTVKSSNRNYEHQQFSEELLESIPEV